MHLLRPETKDKIKTKLLKKNKTNGIDKENQTILGGTGPAENKSIQTFTGTMFAQETTFTNFLLLIQI